VRARGPLVPSPRRDPVFAQVRRNPIGDGDHLRFRSPPRGLKSLDQCVLGALNDAITPDKRKELPSENQARPVLRNDRDGRRTYRNRLKRVKREMPFDEGSLNVNAVGIDAHRYAEQGPQQQMGNEQRGQRREDEYGGSGSSMERLGNVVSTDKSERGHRAQQSCKRRTTLAAANEAHSSRWSPEVGTLLLTHHVVCAQTFRRVQARYWTEEATKTWRPSVCEPSVPSFSCR
jgi:hypothetical protein